MATIMTVTLMAIIVQINSEFIGIPQSITSIHTAFAYHGKEIVLSGKDSSLVPVHSDEGRYQVRGVFNYNIRDPIIVNDPVRAVMQIYSPNGTLLKTSSSPTTSYLNDSGGTLAIATTLENLRTESVMAKIALMNSIKTTTISNKLLVGVGITGSTFPAEHKDDTQAEIQQFYNDESNMKLQQYNELSFSDKIPSRPELENKELTKKKGEVSTGHNALTAEIEPGSQIVDSIVMQPLKTNAPVITSEICVTGKDNHDNIRMDFSESNCNPTREKPANQLAVDQEEIMHTTLEVCDDDQDNDMDGKVDFYDEECGQGIKTSLSLPHKEYQSFDNKQQEWVGGDVQQFDDKDDDDKEGD